MADSSLIEWTAATWNPVTRCTKISPGCDNSYAARSSERFRGTPGHPFENGFDLTLRPERIKQPLAWTRPRKIFVNSMSDLFHKEVPRAFIEQVFDAMEQAHWHEFQMLTKRSSLMRSFLKVPLPNRFSRYVFVEWDPGRASELQLLRQEYGSGYKIEVFNGEAADALDVLLAGDLGQPNHLAVTFLDPFGMQVSWSTTARLAATKRIEVVINFPLGMAIQRVLPRSGVVCRNGRPPSIGSLEAMTGKCLRLFNKMSVGR